ncbi:MAG: phosphoribosylanthranilate isomerase [Pseudomonadota bacterium]
MEIKICCIQSLEEAELARAAGATAIGLVSAMPSGPGPIPDEVIAELCGAMKGLITTVLLTSETSVEGVISHVERTQPSAVQLVDRVAAGVIPALRLLQPGVQIIEVVHVSGPEALEQAKASKADVILLDSGKAGSGVLGGTGQTHDWALSAKIVAESAKPVWLAGGLTPENVAEAISAVRPAGVDVCSKLRPNGRLDPDLLAQFISAAQGHS